MVELLKLPPDLKIAAPFPNRAIKTHPPQSAKGISYLIPKKSYLCPMNAAKKLELIQSGFEQPLIISALRTLGHVIGYVSARSGR